ncbi:hypothetical protein [Saccharopolyspora shandongensis]|uniref:hypothetical protein n=1 Tax=Saccharopolyspora shandongensis TaxID=418495 RepID=UPI00340A663B
MGADGLENPQRREVLPPFQRARPARGGPTVRCGLISQRVGRCSWFVGEIGKVATTWDKGALGKWSADELERGAHDFSASYYYWADFNLFYGPSTDIRGDDPDEEFDTGGDGIVAHYKEMKKLNDEIARMVRNEVRDKEKIRKVIGRFQTLAKQGKTRTPDDPSKWVMNGGRWVRRSAKGRWPS